ncbi:MAG: carbohydrate binding family 9 domain-containing protein [Candidatus Marinimicrobia bacterium]|nr:carbohydrate binding family 9 domain-containing protein [Candidatus Neomarinimicrobiota bacterium]
MKNNIHLVLMSLIMATSTAYAGESILGDEVKFIPNIQPRLEISKTSAKIIIDGELNDAGWVGANPATNFTQFEPVDMTKPSSRTVAMLTYDDEYLYVAISAYDDNPDAIRSTLRDRDKIGSDDLVGFILDTYGDASWAYQIYSNAMGIQGDARWTQNGEDESFDIVFASAGKITEDGYQVEFAVPFASLRFPEKNVQDWKITFWRVRPRESREEYSWAAISKNDPNFLGQFGTLVGMENVKSGK